MNALYSGAMTQYMPTEILGKVNPEEVPDIQSITPDAEIGYIVIEGIKRWKLHGKYMM